MLLPRYRCGSGGGFYDNYDDDYCSSPWDRYGRWIALAVIVVVAILIFFVFACFSARRRRRRGNSPMYGTGWMANKPGMGPPSGPPPQYGQQFDSQPVYGQPGGGYGGGQNQGYYAPGQQASGIELQQPPNTYQGQPPYYGGGGAGGGYRGTGGEDVYAPPSGPPPSHSKDGVIR